MPKPCYQLDLAILHKVANNEKGLGLFRDNDSSVWKIEKSQDGTEHIVRCDSEKQDWSTATDEKKQTVILFYKDTPIQKFCASVCGFNDKSADAFCRFIAAKAKSDMAFVQRCVKGQSLEFQQVLKSKYVELFKIER